MNYFAGINNVGYTEHNGSVSLEEELKCNLVNQWLPGVCAYFAVGDQLQVIVVAQRLSVQPFQLLGGRF